MTFSTDTLRYDELVVFKLRTLYSQHGYAPYRTSRFEEYELYASNRAFLPHGDIIAFNGAGGRLMALRPDVTLSIVKSLKGESLDSKLYYNESVYRTVHGELKEKMQVGLERIGDINNAAVGEVLMLARQSLDELGKNARLDISHNGFLGGLLSGAELGAEQKQGIIKCFGDKNAHGIQQICFDANCPPDFCERLTTLTTLYGEIDAVLPELERISINGETDTALGELKEQSRILGRLGVKDGVNIDFSVINDITYYSGIIFQGFVEGVPSMVLSGGRYDELLRSFGKKGGAIGFAVYPEMASHLEAGACAEAKTGKPSARQKISHGGLLKLEAQQAETAPSQTRMLGVALPKGRLGEKALEIFSKAGYDCPDMNTDSRKLVFENPQKGIRYFWVKPTDVSVYVERGVADIGVVGKDTLMESRSDVYELLDLGIGKCRVCIAGVASNARIGNIGNAGVAGNADISAGGVGDDDTSAGRVGDGGEVGGHNTLLRVATKFPNIAREHYSKCGRDIDIIELHGSIELAPLLGLSDVIVDLVETGKTLDENNMEVYETITGISARLIANKTSHKFNGERINKLAAEIAKRI